MLYVQKALLTKSKMVMPTTMMVTAKQLREICYYSH